MTHFINELWMGPGTLKIDPKLYQTNRDRLICRLRLKGFKESAVLLQGGNNVPIYNTDQSYYFRQEPFFNWTFGIQETGCYGLINILTGKSIGFFPRIDYEDIQWEGPSDDICFLKQKYVLDETYYVDELTTILKNEKYKTLLVLDGVNSDSNLSFPKICFNDMNTFCFNSDVLYNEISDLRAIKTALELEVLKYAIRVSSEAHKVLMKFVKAGLTQFQCESEFRHYCFSKGGCRFVGYNCICPTGKSASILHYGHSGRPNDETIKNGDICCFDLGAVYFGYTADITCSFPINGKFSCDQKLIYEAVLAANFAVRESAKPGVSWKDMHELANKVLLEKLKSGGLLQGSVDDMMKAELAYTFQPHGLGHLLGLDVHDAGGYLPHTPERSSQKSFKLLRSCRILEKGMVLTIEPGCYFIDYLLDEALKDCNLRNFLVKDAIERFRNFGGVRIEDDVLITETGVEVLNNVPRTVKEIESFMACK